MVSPSFAPIGTADPQKGGDAWLCEAITELSCGLRDRLKRMRRKGRSSPTQIHDLRVICRRMLATVDLCDGDSAEMKELVERLDALRRRAGGVRNADVLAELLDGCTERRVTGAAHWLQRRVQGRRRRASVRLREAVEDARGLGKRAERVLLKGAGEGGWRQGLQALLKAAEVTGAGVKGSVERLHELRVAIKRVRYAVELCGPGLGAERVRAALGRLVDLQRALGELNDAAMLVKLAMRAEGRAKKEERKGELRRLVAVKKAEMRESAKRGRALWREAAGVIKELRGLVQGDEVGVTVPPREGVERVRRLAVTPVQQHDGGVSRGVGRAGDGEKPVRIAAIDIGTNSTRLIIAEAHPDGSYRVLDDEKELTRLGTGLDGTGRLDASNMEHGIAAVERMTNIARGFGVQRLRAVATCAVREAANGDEFRRRCLEKTGIEVEVVSAEEEAFLEYRSVAAAFDLSSLTVSMVDIGGGSTEVVTASGGLIERVDTLPIGAVKMTERYGGPGKAGGKRLKELRHYLRGYFAEKIGKLEMKPQLVIGSGGTLTSLAAMAMHRAQQRSGKGGPMPLGALRGYEVQRGELKSIFDELRGMTLSERMAFPGLSADRADIIVPGLAILHELCRYLGARRVRVHDGGIRDGLLLAMVAELFPKAAERITLTPTLVATDRMTVVRRFARSCRCDEAHGEHVAKLSLRLFDQLAALGIGGGGLAEEAREILQAGALLLDVGYIVNYEKHHRHSYNLIVHSELAGWSRKELKLIAAIARYHRGAMPRDEHGAMEGLSADERRMVASLSAIVRVAVGLDRTHNQAVRDVRVARVGGDGAGLRVIVESAMDPSVDIWGAQRKSELFTQVFGVEPTYVWAGGSGERGAAREGGDALKVSVAGPRLVRARTSA